MCRIFGYLGKASVSEQSLHAVSSAQLHGGPDQLNFIQKDCWALGNNRLMIQGISGGRQPFNLDKVYAVYNGEIYNHDELRNDLKHKGYEFQDNCDGNVILPLYLEYGETAFSHMDGMFVIAIMDLRDNPELILANDPIAIKSAYYFLDQGQKTIYFASEIGALLEFNLESIEINSDAVDEFFTMRTVCSEQTIINGVKTLKPASILKYKLNSGLLSQESYQTKVQISLKNQDELSSLLESELISEVASLSKAEVPICFINSGGLDSSLLTAMAAKELGQKIMSFHVCYKGNWPSDERYYAKKVADFVGADHYEVELGPDQFPELIQEMIPHLGQPNSAPHALSSFGMFKQIKNAGFTVAIAGEGADEVFVGYERFLRAFDNNSDWLDLYLDKFGAFRQSYKKSIYSDEFLSYLERSLDCEQGLRLKLSHLPTGEERLNALMHLDQYERFPYYILRRTDHMSMAHAVEVRVPFCQPKIIQLGNDLPIATKTNGQYTKIILNEIGRKYLPVEIIERKKQPFTLPIQAIMLENRRVAEFIQDILSSTSALENKFLSVNAMRNLFKDFQKHPSEDLAQVLWSSLILVLWLDWFNKNKEKRISCA